MSNNNISQKPNMDGINVYTNTKPTEIYNFSSKNQNIKPFPKSSNILSIKPIDKERLMEFKVKLLHQKQTNNSYHKNSTLDQKLNSGWGMEFDFASDYNPTHDRKKLNLEELSQDIMSSSSPIISKKNSRSNRYMVATIFTSFILLLSVFTISSISNRAPESIQKAKAESTFSDLEIKKNSYKLWIESKNNGKFSPLEGDIDKDGLTNYEEFLIGSNPVSPYSCNSNITDNQNLINLINPSTCKAIDMTNSEEVKRFAEVISLPQIASERNQEIIPSIGKSSSSDSSSDKDIMESATQKKVSAYIKKFRSTDEASKYIPLPVSSDYYISTSKKYDVPLKYVLAIARLESRFGTNQLNADGELNKIGSNKNIFSLGLDDSGNNTKFSTWEEGVDEFGKWYKNQAKKEISDCDKWRIYNPNGDYCQKVEQVAVEIESLLKG